MEKDKKEPIPSERLHTIRHEIIETLREGVPLNTIEISQAVHIMERDVYNHLHHIEKTLKAHGKKLIVEPARCGDCSFIFKGRERFKAPSKCPECDSERIEPPLFSIVS